MCLLMEALENMLIPFSVFGGSNLEVEMDDEPEDSEDPRKELKKDSEKERPREREKECERHMWRERESVGERK